MATNKCSAKNCTKIATRFDAASIELFACKEHETKWRNQMIDLGVSCVTSQTNPSDDEKCGDINCKSYGYFMRDGIGYCYTCAYADTLCTYIDTYNNVTKSIIKICEKNHRSIYTNDPSSLHCRECEKLKNNQ